MPSIDGSQRDSGGGHAPDKTNILQFALETASDSVSDLDLHIIPLYSHQEALTSQLTTSRPRQPHEQQRQQHETSLHKPRWVRRRILTEQDEIVDQLVDLQTRRISWTAHRPTRGWYLHLRSPNLPSNTALSLQAAPRREDNDDMKATIPFASSSTPLMLSVGTRLRTSALGTLQSSIPDIFPISTDSSRHQQQQQHARARSADFTAVQLDAPHGYPPSQPRASPPSPVLATSDQQQQNAQTARTTSIEEPSSSKSHARKRSAGRSISGASSNRSVSNSSQMTTIVHDEADEEVEKTEMEKGHTMNGARKVQAPRIEVMEAVQEDVSAPQRCNFILCDGPPKFANEKPDVGAQGQEDGWVRWAKRLLYTPVRPSQSFSITWVGAASQPSPPSSSSAQDLGTMKREIEIVRFIDESSFWSWKSQRMGRILVQQGAIEALNLDLAMWIALTLAYLNFLQERDGYNAAADG